MGGGIAANYLKAGYEVIIWNRSPEKTTDLQAAGASLAASPKVATEQADIIFEVTANDESSQSVWQGVDGILAGADANKILIVSGTFSVDWTAKLADQCAKKGIKFFDMPLTGGRAGAESGTLTLLVGGDKQKLENLRPELSAISEKILYFGPATSGMKYKLILNSIQAAHLAAFGEAMRLATEQGLNPEDVGSALSERPGGIVTNIAWRAYRQHDIPLTFSVNWILKDLEYAKRSAANNSMPILDDVLAAYTKAQNDGQGEADWAIVVKN